MPNKSSRRWLKEHFSDSYVKKAHKMGYRSRAIYKLLEINEAYHLFKPGMTIIDLGAAPGGWSQYVAKIVRPAGRVIAVDILPMEPLEDVHFIWGDFSESATLPLIQQSLPTGRADWVISDMAPNMSGNENIDIPRVLYLAELALDFAVQILNPAGGFLIKAFQGEGIDELLRNMKKQFKTVIICKPKASRNRSREVYILARKLNVEGG